MNARGLPIVLVAEDDPADRALLQEAFQAAGTSVDLRLIPSGDEFLDYLYCRAPYTTAERPDLILLDLNMPRIDGRELLRQIKAEQALKPIPVVVLTTSTAEEDIIDAYDSGANTYITKPSAFDDLVSIVRGLCDYWFRLCLVPGAVAWRGSR